MSGLLAAPQSARRKYTDPRRSASRPWSSLPGVAVPPIHRLQRAVGNRAINRLLHSRTIQPKLTVSHPEDESEREADRVADQVMRMPDPVSGTGIQRSPLKVLRMCTECEDELQRKADLGHAPIPEEEEDFVQAKVESSPNSSASTINRKCESCEDQLQRETQAEPDEEKLVSAKREAGGSPLASGGGLESYPAKSSGAEQELAPPSRSFFSPRFGANFSGVRVHTDSRSQDAGEIVHRGSELGGLPDHDDLEAGQLHLKGTPTPTLMVTNSLADNINALKGGGNPLPDGTRAFFEPRFGADFSDVRLHTGLRAEETAKSINARALTVGRDIAFGRAQFAPESQEGQRLLAHELTHVVQQDSGNGPLNRIQRAPVPAGTPSTPPAEVPKPKFPKTGETVTFAGIELSENPDQLREAMLGLVITGLPKHPVPPGIMAPFRFLNMIMLSTPPMVHQEPGSAGYQESHRREVLKTKIVPVLKPVIDGVYAQGIKIITDFEKVMKDNALKTLAASRVRAEAERVRYGISTKKVKHEHLFGLFTTTETTHSIADTKSPTLKLMTDAAKLLLARRKLIRAKALEVDEHFGCAQGVCAGDPEFPRLQKELVQMRHDYQKVHLQIAFEFPVLDRLGALEGEPGPFDTTAYKFKELERIATGDNESERAATLGDQIEDTLEKNEKTRQGVENKKVNLWRLQSIFELSKAQSEVDANPFRKKLIDEHWQNEQPNVIDSVLEGIALLILNIAAIVLAAPTGGASLAVAFGVNAALAAKHTMDYLLDKAVAGSDMVRAQALSQDDPSFVWLAIEIIGVGLDGAAAVSAMRAMRPVVKAAEIASKEGKVASAIKSIEDAAKPFEKPGLAKRIIDKLPKARTAALESAGATKAEVGQWAKATLAFETEAADTLAPAVRSTVGTEVKISRAGHIFTCSSPCKVIRDKYAELLAAGVRVKGEAGTLEEQLVAFEKRALKAAEETKLAKSADEVATAKKAAEALEKEIAMFEQKVAKEAGYLGAMKKISGLDPAVSAKIAQLEKDAIVKIGTLDAEAIEKLSKLDLNTLKKLTELPEETLKNLAKFGEASLKKALEQTPLTAGKNFKQHFIDRRDLLEKTLGIKVGKLKEGGGDAFLKALTDAIKDGTFKYAGQGTLKKGQAVVNIFRGKGVTVVTQATGEWVTLLKSGEGLDLAIQMVP